MKIGIGGFAQTGKSTVFQLLTGAAPDPHAALGGQLGVAHVADPRLDFLRSLFQPRKCTGATIDLVDLPALVGEDRSENARRLAAAREADGMIVVLGAYAGTDPAEELGRFRDEMHLADMEVTATRIQRVKASFHKGRADVKALEHEQALLERIYEAMESGSPAAVIDCTADERKLVAGFRYLTEKPLMAIANVGEDQPHDSVPKGLGVPAASLCANLELELAELDDEDRAMLESLPVQIDAVAESIEDFRLRQAIERFIDIGRKANQYFDSKQPWVTRKTDLPRTGTTLYVCCQVVRALCGTMAPFMPDGAGKLAGLIGVVLPEGGPEGGEDGWNAAKDELPAGAPLQKPVVLFPKLDKDVVAELAEQHAHGETS